MRRGRRQRPWLSLSRSTTRPSFSADPLGWPVTRVDDGDEPVDARDIAGVVAAGGRGFGGQATTLERRPNVVADLDLGHPVDLLGGQAAVADELAAVAQREQPQPEAVLAVQPLVPRDPGQRLLPALGVGNPTIFVIREWHGAHRRGEGRRAGSGRGWWVSCGQVWSGPDVADGVPVLPLDRALLVVVGGVSIPGAFCHQAGRRIVHVGPEPDLGQLERGERP